MVRETLEALRRAAPATCVVFAGNRSLDEVQALFREAGATQGEVARIRLAPPFDGPNVAHPYLVFRTDNERKRAMPNERGRVRSWSAVRSGHHGATVEFAIDLEDRRDAELLVEALKAFGLKLDGPPGWSPSPPPATSLEDVPLSSEPVPGMAPEEAQRLTKKALFDFTRLGAERVSILGVMWMRHRNGWSKQYAWAHDAYATFTWEALGITQPDA